jgi:hypothetical protein
MTNKDGKPICPECRYAFDEPQPFLCSECLDRRRETRVYYDCGVNWQHEWGETSVRPYDSLEKLKERRGSCWKSCGVVKLTVTAEWVEPQCLTPIGRKP